MMCCLAEAMFARDREFLASSGGKDPLRSGGKDPSLVVAMHRDEKNGKLQVDFTACREDLSTRAGVIGIISNKGGA